MSSTEAQMALNIHIANTKSSPIGFNKATYNWLRPWARANYVLHLYSVDFLYGCPAYCMQVKPSKGCSALLEAFESCYESGGLLIWRALEMPSMQLSLLQGFLQGEYWLYSPEPYDSRVTDTYANLELKA